MSKEELDNLVKIGQLKAEPGTQVEFDGLVDSARKRLADARNEKLSFESRFDLAYNAAHAFALAALRRHNYRSGNRYVVFQVLPHTLGLDTIIWRVLAKCHDRRNLAEYEGHFEVDEQLLNDLIDCTTRLEAAGQPVERKQGLGSAVIFRSLAGGDIDAYVDYSGTLWTNVLGRSDVMPREAMLEALTTALRERYGVTVLGALGFENAYARRQIRYRAATVGRNDGDIPEPGFCTRHHHVRDHASGIEHEFKDCDV